MTNKNQNSPAMPIELNGFGQYAPTVFTGLTKREYAAITIMAGMASTNHGYHDYHDYKYRASDAVKQADALFDELEKTK